MRYRLHGGPHSHTELIGVLQNVTAGSEGSQVLKVLDKRGRTHVVASADVEAARVL